MSRFIVEYFVPKSSMEILNPSLSNDKIEFCKLSSLMSYVSEISKKIKDGSTPIVSHFFSTLLQSWVIKGCLIYIY